MLSPFDSFAGVLAGAYVPRPGDAAFDASKYNLYQVASLPTLTGTGVQVRWEWLEPESRASLPISATTVGWFASGNLRLDFLNGGAIVNAAGNNLQGEPGHCGADGVRIGTDNRDCAHLLWARYG